MEMREERQMFLQRAMTAAKYTLPMLFPKSLDADLNYQNQLSQYDAPYQSVCAQGVNNLASLAMLALFPVDVPFYKYDLEDAEVQKALESKKQQIFQEVAQSASTQEEAEEATAHLLQQHISKIEEALGRRERSIFKEVSNTDDRDKLYTLMVHDLVAGNVVFHMPKGAPMRIIPLTNFVQQKDNYGTVLDIITVEWISPRTLDDDVKAKLSPDKLKQKCLPLYRHQSLEGKHYIITEELCGVTLKSEKAPKATPPMYSVGYRYIPGENYCRGMVEEVIGDVFSLDGLEQAALEYSVGMAKFLIGYLTGQVDKEILINAPNGGFVPMQDANAVFPVRLGSGTEPRLVLETIERKERRLAEAFLMSEAARRDAERVTAEEIKQVIASLEKRHAGFYSNMHISTQLPYLMRKIFLLEEEGKLEPLPNDLITPKVTAGLEALGREGYISRLVQFCSIGQQVLGPQFEAHLIGSEFLRRLGTNMYIEARGLIRPQSEIDKSQAAMKQEAFFASLIDRLGPEAVKQLGPTLMNGGAQPNGNQQQQQQEGQQAA